MKKELTKFLIELLMYVISTLLYGVVIMLMWNMIAPSLSLATIHFVHAWGMKILIDSLLGKTHVNT